MLIITGTHAPLSQAVFLFPLPFSCFVFYDLIDKNLTLKIIPKTGKEFQIKAHSEAGAVV